MQLHLLLSCLMKIGLVVSEYDRASEGYPLGYIADCLGSTDNITIPNKYMKEIFFIIRTRSAINRKNYRKKYNFASAVEDITTDRNLYLKDRKTVMFVTGFMDSTSSPIARMVEDSYTQKHYNVILMDVTRLTSYPYPISARLVRPIGRRIGEIISHLHKASILEAKNLEMVGLSLGCHISSFIAKKFFQITNEKISRITALDAAGPCFRHLGPEDRIDKSDAIFVEGIHTNIDGLGIAARIGHVDIYVNGGEFQLAAIPELPCSLICSHVRSVFLWLSAIKNAGKFIGVKCASIQDARDRNCYGEDREIFTMGIYSDRQKEGVYYLATSNVEPYFMGSNGLVKENDAYFVFFRDIYKSNVLE